MKINKILVPIDFSDYSKKALEYAFFWGDEFGADITLIHVNTLFHAQVNLSTVADTFLKIADELEQKIHHWMKQHHRTYRTGQLDIKIVQGASAAKEILKQISRHSFDLVVMGTHGRTGSKHILLGSVAEKVSRLSATPVLTVHLDSQSLEIKEILVPIDLNDFAKKIVDQALSLANVFGARIHLLHVIERIIPDSPGLIKPDLRKFFALDPEAKKRTTELMCELIGDDFRPGMHIQLIEIGDPHKEIIRYANKNKIDLIMMATRGFSKFDYFWSWGSVSEKIVRHANCPVFVVRQQVLGNITTPNP